MRGGSNRSRVLLGLNLAGVAAAGAFAAIGVRRPGYVETGSSADPLSGFWATSSALRTWALAGPLVAGVVRDGRPDPSLLAVAGLVQLGDSALGIRRRDPSMALLPAAMGIVHLYSARHFAD